MPPDKNIPEDWRSLAPPERIETVGYRAYIGGSTPESWYGIGMLQYHYLTCHGLNSDHVFLDVACGSLRLGQFLIPYLQPHNYIGIDQSKELIEAALENEIPEYVTESRQPHFIINSEFDLTDCPEFDFAIAQSLFTHLTLEDIRKCFAGLKRRTKPSTKFYFTFFEGEDAENPTHASHPNINWHYSFEQIKTQAADAGWNCTYIGHWNHPRNQKLALATPAL